MRIIRASCGAAYVCASTVKKDTTTADRKPGPVTSLRDRTRRTNGTDRNGVHERCRCPVDSFQQMISGKYKLRLIWDLQSGPLRYGELKKNLAALVPGSKEITARVLSRELKALAALGLIVRTDHGTVPPKVEYALSPRGQSLIPVISVMRAWGMEHLIAAP
jgi:DNA-binding HxlR family transcriptional regulator